MGCATTPPAPVPATLVSQSHPDKRAMSKAEAVSVLTSVLRPGAIPGPGNQYRIGALDTIVFSLDEEGIVFVDVKYVEVDRSQINIGPRETLVKIRYANVPGATIKLAFADITRIEERKIAGFLDQKHLVWSKNLRAYTLCLATGAFPMTLQTLPQSSPEMISALLALCTNVK
jgi:hypothetical protein